MGSPKSDQKDLINTWVHSCRTEKINPLNPDRLPLLFAVDADFPGGFKYSLDDGIFPQPADGIPPLELLHEIQRRMAETQIVEQRQSTIALLAPKIRRHLLDENYCRNRGRIALAPLCKIVLANEDLATAVFGDIDSAQARSRRIDAFPPPVFWISWARAMQNKNWDGRR